MLHNHPQWIEFNSKANLHRVFTEVEHCYPTTWTVKNEDGLSAAAKAVKNEIQRTQVNINQLDENGNTLLHRAIWFRVSAGGRSPRSVDESLINVEAFLQMGADPSLINHVGDNAVETFIKLALETRNNLGQYVKNLFNILKAFSSAHLFTQAIDHCGDLIQEKLDYYLNFLDVNGLPLGTLENFLTWLKKKFLQCEVDPLLKKINAQLDYIKNYPYLDDALATIINKDEKTSFSIFRAMLIYDENYPLLNLILQTLDTIKAQNLLVDDLLKKGLKSFIEKYAQICSTLESAQAIPEPLSAQEIQLRNAIFTNLDSALNGKIYLTAKKNYVKHVPSSLYQSHQARFDQFPKAGKENVKQLVAEMHKYAEVIRSGQYLGTNGFLATQRKRKKLAEAAENRIQCNQLK